MTRINIIPIEQVSDQHLMAEYRELPRMIPFIDKWIEKGCLPVNQPTYVLGKGHMKFFLDKGPWLSLRHARVVTELINVRGYNLSHREPLLFPSRIEGGYFIGEFSWDEILLNQNRIREKILLRPLFYTWTCREQPLWTY